MVNHMMLATFVTASFVLDGVYSLAESSSEGKSEPACLLQSTFSSNDLTLGEVADEVTDEASSAPAPKSAILFESQVLEETTTKELLVRSRSRSRSCKAHLAYLARKTSGLEHAHNVSNKNMDEVVKGFISKQSGSEDACSSQLLEAKHQLNQIHEYVQDLTVQVNTTELAIVALDKGMEDKIKEIEDLDDWKEQEILACEKAKQEYIEMYAKLSAEMKEMKQIASPGVAMDVTTGIVSASPGAEAAVGLVQMPSHTNGTMAKDLNKLQLLIKGTKSAAKQLLTCQAKLAGQKLSLVQSPLLNEMQRSVVVDAFEVRDVSGPPQFNMKLSEFKKSCVESFGPKWKTANVRQVARWCGCNLKNKNNEGWCKCPSKLEPLLGEKDQWTLVGLVSGQAMGKGYGYTVKFAAKGAQKTAIDLCMELRGNSVIINNNNNGGSTNTASSSNTITNNGKHTVINNNFKPFKPAEVMMTTTTPRIDKHVDPVGDGVAKPFETAEVMMTTSTPRIDKHVDPVGDGPAIKPFEMKPMTLAPFDKHVDPVEPYLTPATAAPAVYTMTTPRTIIHVDPPDALGNGPSAGARIKRNGFGGDLGEGAEDDNDDYSPMTIDDLRDQDAMDADAAAADIKNAASSPEQCEKEKQELQEVYVKTYVELARLKDEYDELANSTACFDTVESTYKSRKVPLQEAIDKLIKDIDQKTKVLQGLRPRLESATKAESQLRKQIKTLSEECAGLPATVSNLNKVRDAIQALSKCPGLSRVQFSLPKWTGTWAVVQVKAKKLTDEQLDEELNSACAEQAEGARAAEVAEIEEQTVEGIPLTNTADFPLIGACPACEGDEADDFPSKHKRICWRQGKDLDHEKKVTNCAGGKKAVLCVVDRENIRQIPGEA